MTAYIGTSGYSYPAWRGKFYPLKTPTKSLLPTYASLLACVEINQSFYRLPTEAQMQSWSDSVPDHFRFVIKAPKEISHTYRLGDKAIAILPRYLELCERLGGKLGALFLQLPPNMKISTEKLEKFLREIPHTTKIACEFRHASWFNADVMALLRAHNAALVWAETDEEAARDDITADWGYCRFRKTAYTAGEISAWSARISKQWDDWFGFFMHDEDGTSGQYALMMKQFVTKS